MGRSGAFGPLETGARQPSFQWGELHRAVGAEAVYSLRARLQVNELVTSIGNAAYPPPDLSARAARLRCEQAPYVWIQTLRRDSWELLSTPAEQPRGGTAGQEGGFSAPPGGLLPALGSTIRPMWKKLWKIANNRPKSSLAVSNKSGDLSVNSVPWRRGSWSSLAACTVRLITAPRSLRRSGVIDQEVQRVPQALAA